MKPTKLNPPYPPRELRRLRRAEDRKPLDSAILAPVVMGVLYDVAGRTKEMEWLLVGPLAAQAYHESRVVLEIDVLLAGRGDADRFVHRCAEMIKEQRDFILIVEQEECPFDVLLRVHSPDSTDLPPDVVREWIVNGTRHRLGDSTVRLAGCTVLPPDRAGGVLHGLRRLGTPQTPWSGRS